MIKSTTLVFLLCLTGCAYNLGYGHKQLPGKHKEVSIPMFDNRTQEVGVESYFTNALRQQFHRSKIAQVVNKNNSEVTLIGVINEVIYHATAQASSPTLDLPSNTVLTTDYRVVVRARLSLKRNFDNKIIWSDLFEGERVYSAPQISTPGSNSANANYNHSARQQNLTAIAAEMMSEAHERMTENF